MNRLVNYPFYRKALFVIVFVAIITSTFLVMAEPGFNPVVVNVNRGDLEKIQERNISLPTHIGELACTEENCGARYGNKTLGFKRYYYANLTKIYYTDAELITIKNKQVELYIKQLANTIRFSEQRDSREVKQNSGTVTITGR